MLICGEKEQQSGGKVVLNGIIRKIQTTLGLKQITGCLMGTRSVLLDKEIGLYFKTTSNLTQKKGKKYQIRCNSSRPNQDLKKKWSKKELPKNMKEGA